ncbi:DNL zinc finger-domain-containing protein [Aspergillus californicus]
MFTMQQSLRLSRGLRALPSSFSQPQPIISRVSPGASSRLYSQLNYRPSLPTTLHKTNETPSISFTTTRYNSNTSSPAPLTNRTTTPQTDAENEAANKTRREQEPQYQIQFTCRPCGERSTHTMSKHAYHRGTVLIRCPKCENRHVISDNLKIFFENRKTLDDILAEGGQKIMRGQLSGDVEFWDDGSVKQRKKEGEEKKEETKETKSD